MEFSRIFGFLKIWSQCIKIFFENFELIASIAALSLLPSSVLFILFSFSVQSAIAYVVNNSTTDSSALFYLQTAIFSVELTFIFSYLAISRAAGIATVIATAASYSGPGLSLRDLFPAVKSKWRNPFSKTYRRLGNPIHYLWLIAVIVAIQVLMHHPNPFTIAIVSALVATIFVYMLYGSVVPAVAAVILVVEDGCEAAEVVERAERLVEEQRLHGFMANLFSYVLALIVCLGFWMIVGDKGGMNLTVYGLFFGNCAIAMTICLNGVYTVYYFRCREYHGEEIHPVFGNYTPLPSNIP